MPVWHSRNHNNNATCHIVHTTLPPREQLGVTQDIELPLARVSANQSEDDLDPLPLYIQKPQPTPPYTVSKPKYLRLLDTGSHTIASTSTTATATPTPTQLQPKKRSISLPLAILPGNRHTQKHDWIDSASPTTPTQAMTRLDPIATTTLSLSDSPSTTPTATLPNTSLHSPTTTIKPRARALTITSATTSSPRSPQPSFLTEPHLKTRQKPIAIPVPVSLNTSLSPRQNSASNFNLNTQNSITSPRSSPPPDFLLDDDPFANLTGGPVGFRGNRKLSPRVNEDAKSPRSPLVNDDHECEHEHDEGRGIAAGLMIGPTATSSSLIPQPAHLPTAHSVVACPPVSSRSPISTTTAATTTSKSTPTSPSQNAFSAIEVKTRSSFPSIAFSSASQPQQPPNLPPTFSHPFLTTSRQPSFSHHSSSASSSSSQHIVPHPHRPSPAHQRPAFKSRPSLPSLDTLAKMDFIPGAGFGVRKVRKGKVGAGLPFEPWNSLDSVSSGETSPVGTVFEGLTGIANGSGDEGAGEAVPPVPPLPTSVSVSRSIPASTESTSWNQDSKTVMSASPSLPTLRHSSSSITLSSSPSSSSRQAHTHTSTHLPPNASLTFVANALTSQPIPMGQKPSLPSQILAIGPDVGVVYGYGGDRGNEMISPPMSPPLTVSHDPLLSPPRSSPPTMPRSSLHMLPPSADIHAVTDSTSPGTGVAVDVDLDVFRCHELDKVSRSSPKDTVEAGLDSYARRHDDLYAEGIDAEVRDYENDGDDVDVDFMDQFMGHYEEDGQRDGFGLQEQREVGEEENDVWVGQRLAVDEDERRMPLSRSPITSPSTSLSEMALTTSASDSGTISAISDLTSAFPDSIAVDTSGAILAPTLRTRIRPKKTVNTATTDADMDSEGDNSSLFDSYLYNYPYLSSRQNPETETELEISSTSSTSGLTPPVSTSDSMWSPSGSVPGSRSRSLSSTHTSSFGSEESSGPQSFLVLDEDHMPQIPIKSTEDVTDTVLHPEVSMLGSPVLSMLSGGNDDFVSVPGPGSIHLRPLSSDSNHEVPSTSNDNTKYIKKDDNDVNIHDIAREVAGESFNLRHESRHSIISKLWVGGDVSTAEATDEGKVVDDELESGIVGMKHELEVKVNTEMEEDIENGQWEYITGGPFMGGSNGSSHAGGLNGHELEGERYAEEAIAIVTPDEQVNSSMNLVARHSPLVSATSPMTMPTTAQFISTSGALLQDDLTCASSTAVAAALAMSTWKQDTSELLEGVERSSAPRGRSGGSRNRNDSYSSTGSVYHATLALPSNLKAIPFEWPGHHGQRDDNDNDDDKKRQRATLERGRRMDQLSLVGHSSGSSTSSSSVDDHYGPADTSPSQSVMNVNPRTQTSRTHSTPSPSPRYQSASTGLHSSRASSTGGSMFSRQDDDDDEEDDREDGRRQTNNSDDDDDDIPLARRIPSALTAQRSIRHQVRQEREQKKQEKALRSQAETARTRLMTLRPSGTIPSSLHDAALPPAAVVSSSQANIHHQHLEQQQQLRRQRTQTLTGKGSISGHPFSPDDLAKKLRDINRGVDATSSISSTPGHMHSRHRSKSLSRSSWDSQPTEAPPPVPVPHIGSAALHAQRTKSMKDPSSSYRYHPSPSPAPINSAQGPSPTMTLRPMRSFHRPSVDHRPIGADDAHSAASLLDTEQRVNRSSTSATRSQPQTSLSPTPISTPHRRSLSQSRSSIERPSPMTIPEPVPPIPTARISHDEHRKLVNHQSPSRVGSSRTSVDTEKPPRTSSHQHRPAPALPSAPVDPLLVSITSGKPDVVAQQRVFVGDMQRFKMVEIGPSTTAGDVVEMIEAEGSLTGFAGSGGWMVFEVSQDFGMERPVRSFELVTDVQASWNKDKMINYLVLRMTPLAVPLNRSAIPSRSPTHSGYVEWEAKRGRWSKRWMQLREHSIWLSKRDNGRDEVQLCSLSNFDAYQVTRCHRAPKPFAFAVKSTDNLSFFENTADYLHSFSCSEKDGKVWMEKILVARSYVLFQEKHVLFNPKAVNGNASGLSRTGTRKATTQRPAVQPLLTMPPFTGGSQPVAHHDVFEPGSLLSKQP